MNDPFSPKKKSRSWSKLLELDSWIDSSIYNLFSSAGDSWEAITIFFRRFRVYGFRKLLVELSCEGLTLGLAGSILMLALAIPAFEETEKDWRSQSDYSVVFLDRFGEEIGRRGILHNDAEPVDTLPDHFIKAVLATEDRRFFNHFGIDFVGLSRAMVENARAKSVVQGGSTITQQLAKNLFLTNERTLERKIKEAFLALWLEFNLTKKEILKLYLDRAYTGGGTFGAAAAAEFYFGKNIKDVNLAEAAMLAGLYKAPTKYAPHINLPAARARANQVLTNMVQAEFMTEGQVISARRNPADIVERDTLESPNFFLDWAFGEVKRLALGFDTHSLVVRTTLDPGLQRAADEAVESHLRQFGEDYNVSQAAMVVIENGGAVRAIVGGRDYGVSQFNRATSARRQPGSSFKPFVYTTAMLNGYTPKSVMVDSPVTIRGWTPKNYSGRYSGRMSLTNALVRSINVIPVKLGMRMGRKKIVDTAHLMGIDSPLLANPSMPLGSNDLTVMEMATGYGVLMSGGYETGRHGIMQITDAGGKVLYDHARDAPGRKKIIDEKAIGYMNEMLSQVPEWGTGRRAALEGIKSAGKTGTTSAYKDAWYVGYTGNYVTAVWFGNDNFMPTRRLTGGRLPAMTWNRFMSFAHQNIEIKPIPFLKNQEVAAVRKRRSQTAGADDPNAGNSQGIRRKPLSRATTAVLRDIEKALRNAKKLTVADKFARAELPSGGEKQSQDKVSQ